MKKYAVTGVITNEIEDYKIESLKVVVEIHDHHGIGCREAAVAAVKHLCGPSSFMLKQVIPFEVKKPQTFGEYLEGFGLDSFKIMPTDRDMVQACLTTDAGHKARVKIKEYQGWLEQWSTGL